jgi:acetyl-CoA C-acetyltransferase
MLELYDQSTIMGVISLEDMGFCERGKAWMSILRSWEEERNYIEAGNGQLFLNMNGGLKADGNPLGATGGAEVFEIFQQLRGEAGKRQVQPDNQPAYGCIQELEGFGTKAYFYILGREQP